MNSTNLPAKLEGLEARKNVVDAAERLLSAPPSSALAAALAVGRLARVASGDDETDEQARLVDHASSLIEKAASWAAPLSAELGAGPLMGLAPESLERWAADPRGPFAARLADIDRLGAVAAGLEVLAPGSTAQLSVRARVNGLSAELLKAGEAHGAELLDVAVAAAELVAEKGAVPGPDDALLALADLCGQRLEAALRGEPLEAPRAFRLKALDAGVADKLGQAFAKALSRPSPLEVSPDLLELAVPAQGRLAEAGLVLHEAEPQAVEPRPVELMKGVTVTFSGSELEVELASDPKGPVLLVPVVRGEPGAPCAARSGAHGRHLVFSLVDEAELDGYALVVGDRLAFVKRG